MKKQNVWIDKNSEQKYSYHYNHKFLKLKYMQYYFSSTLTIIEE